MMRNSDESSLLLFTSQTQLWCKLTAVTRTQQTHTNTLARRHTHFEGETTSKQNRLSFSVLGLTVQRRRSSTTTVGCSCTQTHKTLVEFSAISCDAFVSSNYCDIYSERTLNFFWYTSWFFWIENQRLEPRKHENIMKIIVAAAKKTEKDSQTTAEKLCLNIWFILLRCSLKWAVLCKLVPAPGLKGIAGSLVEISLHGDSISCICIEVHDGVIIGNILEKSSKYQRDGRIWMSELDLNSSKSVNALLYFFALKPLPFSW